MASTVDLQGVRELLERGAQLVEVLPAEEYEELHLPAAISLPLKELDAQAAERLDCERPVIVYCWDALCDMSPRAAAWLEQLGFDAYDYALSKVDWMAHGLPMEGTGAGLPAAGSSSVTTSRSAPSRPRLRRSSSESTRARTGMRSCSPSGSCSDACDARDYRTRPSTRAPRR